jgi:hypothetical protein
VSSAVFSTSKLRKSRLTLWGWGQKVGCSVWFISENMGASGYIALLTNKRNTKHTTIFHSSILCPSQAPCVWVIDDFESCFS